MTKEVSGFEGGVLGMKCSRKNVPCVLSTFNEWISGAFQRFYPSLFFHRSFARVSPVFAAALLVACSVFFAANSVASSSSADPTAAVKRQPASPQFLRGQDQRNTLNNTLTENRNLEDCQQ